MTIIWCIVPEIWSAMDIIFCHFWTIFCPFASKQPGKSKLWKNEKKKNKRYYHFTHVHHKQQSYNVCFLRYGAQRTEFFVIWRHFLPYYLTNNPSNQNFEKMKKKQQKRGDIILHMRTITNNHKMYGSWNMEHNEHDFLSFWAIFCPFPY